ncbi:MAG: DoxX family membrane protein [Rhodothermales bacterium]
MAATTHRLIEWTDTYRDVTVDLIRIYLGIGLFVRGWLFITDASVLVGLLAGAGESSFASAALVHYVALVHLGGGLLLAFGLLTRVAALVQIPVLVGAVFFVHLNDGLLAAGQSLEFSALVLFLLVVLFFHGSGRLSLDYYLFEREESQAVREAQLVLFAPPSGSVAARRAVVGSRTEEAVVQPVPHYGSTAAQASACTCSPPHDRAHQRVQVERRYGMRALRFLTGTTGTPKEIVFRCRECGNVVEVSTDETDIAQYTYR